MGCAKSKPEDPLTWENVVIPNQPTVISLELDSDMPATARLKESCQPGGLLSRAAHAAVKAQAADVEAFVAEYVMAERGRADTSGTEDVLPPLIPVSSKKTSNAENDDAFRAGALKHEPPTFAFLGHEMENEGLAVNLKELRLPRAKETHEICYEPITKSVFISQMSSGVLVRLPMDANGLLVDDQDAWRVGEPGEAGLGLSGIHNISLSTRHPGCLWISLQYANELILVDVTAANTLRIKQILRQVRE